MPGYTEKFDIDLNDMDLIEEALRGQVKALSAKRSEQACLDSERKLRNVKDLLGRLHNQKVFYRPKQGYIGG
ncbi:MAG: hypothetical protein QNJ20_07765 [Paracoccaceae bacterium]|nr:hypothetical protein [Paracoccaceae bacterium]